MLSIFRAYLHGISVEYDHVGKKRRSYDRTSALKWTRDYVGENIYQPGDTEVDKDRVVGAAKQAKGAIKETAGKAVGDAKLTAEGKSDKVEGKIQNAVGGLKDALKK